jgi:two-component system sensor histidine kinase BaeS
VKLRTRVFVLVWLLVVCAMASMAVLLGRWSIIEIQRVTIEARVQVPPGARLDSLAFDTSQVTKRIERRMARGDVNESVMRPTPPDSFTRRILLAVVIGSLVAALATALLTRQIVGRITGLAAAVRAMRGGQLAQAVPVQGNDELADLARSFNAMSSGLAESEQRRRQLLSDVSHELRTPLTNVIGALEAIQDGLREPGERELAALHEEAMLLVRLVDDLRDVTLADAGELTLHLESVDARDAARQAAEAFPRSADRAAIELDAAVDLPAVRADRRRLAQILRNLLDNARIHAAAGSIVTLRVSSSGGTVRFDVHNVGDPIPAAHLDRLWDRFYRVDASRTRSTGGMGLGLAVVKRLVEAHRGSVAVTSHPGEGTTFSVVLTAA